jgi:hypothetical protein
MNEQACVFADPCPGAPGDRLRPAFLSRLCLRPPNSWPATCGGRRVAGDVWPATCGERRPHARPMRSPRRDLASFSTYIATAASRRVRRGLGNERSRRRVSLYAKRRGRRGDELAAAPARTPGAENSACTAPAPVGRLRGSRAAQGATELRAPRSPERLTLRARCRTNAAVVAQNAKLSPDWRRLAADAIAAAVRSPGATVEIADALQISDVLAIAAAPQRRHAADEARSANLRNP